METLGYLATFVLGFCVMEGLHRFPRHWRNRDSRWPTRYGCGRWALRYYDKHDFMFTEQRYTFHWEAERVLRGHPARVRDAKGYLLRIERSQDPVPIPDYMVRALAGNVRLAEGALAEYPEHAATLMAQVREYADRPNYGAIRVLAAATPPTGVRYWES